MANERSHDRVTHQGYQGWTNYPTWCVALWIDNDEGWCNEAIYWATCTLEENEDETDQLVEMADWLKEFFDGENYQDTASLQSDLLSWAFGMVNWRELATHYLEVARENER